MYDGLKQNRYVVLQDRNAERRAAQLRTRGESVAYSDAPPDLMIASDDLSESAAIGLQQDPSTLGVARVLPLQLINSMPPAAVSTPADSSPADSTPADSAPAYSAHAYSAPVYSAKDLQTSWGLDALGVGNSPFTGEGVTVALLDTGIDASHPTFADPALTIEQRNFTQETDKDTVGHGTHCAATLLGRPWESGGVRYQSGVASGVTRSLMGKVIGSGAGTDALIEAVAWAHREGANVISLSLGYDHAGQLESLVQRYPRPKAASELLAIYLENVRLFDTLLQHITVPVQGKASPLVIAAAGNESDAEGANPYRISAASPASSVAVMAVGAVRRDANGGHSVAPFSNTQVDIVAPGVDIPSAGLDHTVSVLSGTSVACPHVAGIAALHWQRLTAMGLPRSASVARSFITAGASRQSIANGALPQDMGVGLAQAPV